MVTTFRSPIKLEVARDGTPATARGGLVLLFEALAARRILADLPQTHGSPAQGWSDGQMILAVLALNIAGLDRVSDIDMLEADTGLCAIMRRFEPKLFGMSRRAIARRFRGGRGRCFPSARSIRDWLDRFHVAGVHDVEREEGTAWVPSHSERHDLFREVYRRLVAEGVREAGAASVTIDLDATIIASGKRECLYTYRAAERRVPHERGYQPLIAFLPRDRHGALVGDPRRQRAGEPRQRAYPFGARGMSAAPSRAERPERGAFPRHCIIPVVIACSPIPRNPNAYQRARA